MSDLTDRMRTCAAHVLAQQTGDDFTVYRDAADLLIEASNALEMVPEPLGEPMTILEAMTAIEPPPPDLKIDRTPRAVWTTNAGDLPPVPTGSKPAYRPPRVCPQCDSRANKRVFRQDNKVFLACPVCAHAWEYRP